jgi:hypothetical protein
VVGRIIPFDGSSAGVWGDDAGGSPPANPEERRVGDGVVGLNGTQLRAPDPRFPPPKLRQAGVRGISLDHNGTGVLGEADRGDGATGVRGWSLSGVGGLFQGPIAIEARGDSFFWGNVEVSGKINKSALTFKIDHPLDPENKYLFHSGVESPDVLNVYSGNVTTDADGNATVALPDYFEELNEDFRYQLTVIGQLAHVVVAEEIRANQFTIKTDRPDVRVSWQVTGIRKDAWAKMNPLVVEEDKPDEARGTYLHPEAFGQPETRGEGYAREEAFRSREAAGIAEIIEAVPRLVGEEPPAST